MLGAATLLVYAACMGWLGDRLLARATSRIGSPSVVLWVWHGLAVTVLTAIGIGLGLASHDVWEHSLSWLLHADKSRVHDAYAEPQEVHNAWNLALVVLVVLGTTGSGSALSSLRRIRHARAAHRLLTVDTSKMPNLTSVTAAPHEAAVAVLPDPTPLIYCLPGTGPDSRIVVTTGARDLLLEDQLEAALEHERAHLTRNHHRIVLFAEAVAAALRLPRMLQEYPRAVRLLVELEADDRAARRHGAHTVASALLEMSCAVSPSPRAGLAMAGTDAAIRIRRLLDQRRQAPSRKVAAILLPAAIVLGAAPAIAAAIPAISLVGSAHWPEDESPAIRPSSDDFTHHP